MKKIAYSVILLLLAGVILLAGCTQPQTLPAPTPAPTTPATLPDTIKAVANPQYGQILVDANGMTLYYFARDTPFAQTSACSGACLALWPAFGESGAVVSSPLQAADFGVITRADNGRKQVIYKGWPLYYYAPDTAPGETKGYGINNVWYVMGTGGVVTLSATPAPATTIPTTARTTAPTMSVPTTVKLIVPTTVSYGSGGY